MTKSRSSTKATDISQRSFPTSAPAAGTGIASTAGCSPTRHRAFSRTVPSDRRRSSIRRRTAGGMRRGRASRCAGQVFYEMHVGTFTPEGTWRAAMEQLPHLQGDRHHGHRSDAGGRVPRTIRLGIRRRVSRTRRRDLYGTPDDFRAFVDRAHQLGLGVILDVVYNHLGPSGCVHREYAQGYFTEQYDNEWGDALNFDGPDAAPVREYFTANAAYWIDEFHLDGLRLDATQSIHDRSPDHLVCRRRHAVRVEAAGAREIIIVAENERQDTSSPASGPRAWRDRRAWNDDFHHSAVVAMTGRREAYYSDHRGHAAGVHLGGEARLPVSGSAVRLAEAAARHAHRWHPAGGVRELHREPRPDRQLRQTARDSIGVCRRDATAR